MRTQYVKGLRSGSIRPQGVGEIAVTFGPQRAAEVEQAVHGHGLAGLLAETPVRWKRALQPPKYRRGIAWGIDEGHRVHNGDITVARLALCGELRRRRSTEDRELRLLRH